MQKQVINISHLPKSDRTKEGKEKNNRRNKRERIMSTESSACSTCEILIQSHGSWHYYRALCTSSVHIILTSGVRVIIQHLSSNSSEFFHPLNAHYVDTFICVQSPHKCFAFCLYIVKCSIAFAIANKQLSRRDANKKKLTIWRELSTTNFTEFRERVKSVWNLQIWVHGDECNVGDGASRGWPPSSQVLLAYVATRIRAQWKEKSPFAANNLPCKFIHNNM